jgi:hypothetical protein
MQSGRPSKAIAMMKTQILFVATFPLARVEATHRALAVLSPGDVVGGIARHLMGDWGELDEFEWKTTDEAAEYGCRLVSRYRTAEGVCFWIITEADRSVTRIQLPNELPATGRLQ